MEKSKKRVSDFFLPGTFLDDAIFSGFISD
jgi:hypothetical protein